MVAIIVRVVLGVVGRTRGLDCADKGRGDPVDASPCVSISWYWSMCRGACIQRGR